MPETSNKDNERYRNSYEVAKFENGFMLSLVFAPRKSAQISLVQNFWTRCVIRTGLFALLESQVDTFLSKPAVVCSIFCVEPKRSVSNFHRLKFLDFLISAAKCEVITGPAGRWAGTLRARARVGLT